MIASNSVNAAQSDLFRGMPVERQPPKRRKKANRTQRYTDYMSSPEWFKKRAERIFMDLGRCQFPIESGICGCRDSVRNPLQVHHKTYVRLGNEAMGDLITLCKYHHKLTHKQMREYKA